MLIRSQDKTALVKFENIVVNLKLPDSLNVICWSLQDAQRSGGYFVLGEYSTKAKAMKALDMIQEAYVNGHIDYQMPADSEVVVLKHKCVKAFTLDTYDGDGFYVDGYMEIKAGEVYEVGNTKIIDGEIHLGRSKC